MTEPSGAAADGTLFPRTVEVFEGKTLSLPTRPVRILPANGSALDFVLSLCEPERVVALSPVALQYSAGAHAAGVVASLEPRANLGKWSVESALTLNPDLVLVGSWQDEKILAALERAQIPVLRLPDPTSFEGIVTVLETLGRVVGEEERATAEIERLREVVATMSEVSMPQGLRTLSYSNFGNGGSSAGSGTSYDMMISLAGLENVAATSGMKGFESLSLEELLTINPDWILVGIDDENPGLGASERFLSETSGYDRIPAVESGSFLRLPSRLYSTNSLWLVEAARLLQQQVLQGSPSDDR